MQKSLLPIIWTFLIFSFDVSWGQSFYWVAFTDKSNSPWDLENPEAYLSSRALERREKQNIAIDSLDLPVNPSYIQQVLELGARKVHSSKWLNGVTVKTETLNFPDAAMALPFVRNVQLTKRAGQLKSQISKFRELGPEDPFLDIDSAAYGASVYQIAQLNGHFLHKQKFKGEGMHIAVMDAGFYRADRYAAFDSLWAGGQILGTKDFVNPDEPFFEGHYHGMSVLSIMGGNIPGELIGTAPGASYWLLRTEDTFSELLIEEDNWVAAAEFADSAGVDIINSSLGYFIFNDPSMNHTYEDMDGNTTRVTRAANIAATRGMLVFSSAGNEGSGTWKYVIAPSDGDHVIGVGAVNREGVPAPFTSYGPASDGAIKPNVSAMGWRTAVQKSDGTIASGNGTSYSSPVMAGTAACLWQANPHAAAAEVKNAIEQSGHLFNHPDSLLGYGVPDMRVADKILKMPLMEQWQNDGQWLAYPNPVRDYLVLQKNSNEVYESIELSFHFTDGRLIRKEVKSDAPKIIVSNLQTLPTGLLILQIKSNDGTDAVKIFKSP